MAKKSRRQRKAETAKAVSTATATTTNHGVAKSQSQPKETVAQTDDLSDSMAQKAVSFAQDYHYVYTDIRILAVVTILAIGLMVGLSFVI